MRDTQRRPLVSDIDFRRAGTGESKAELRRMLAEAVRNTAAQQRRETGEDATS